MPFRYPTVSTNMVWCGEHALADTLQTRFKLEGRALCKTACISLWGRDQSGVMRWISACDRAACLQTPPHRAQLHPLAQLDTELEAVERWGSSSLQREVKILETAEVAGLASAKGHDADKFVRGKQAGRAAEADLRLCLFRAYTCH